MIKFKTIGAWVNAHNIPECVVPEGVSLKNGMGVTVDFTKKTVALPAGEAVKKDVYLVMNIIDKPEIHSPNEYTIEAGEHVRLIDLASVVNHEIVFDMNAVTGTYADIAVGDKLVFGTDGNMVEGTPTDYRFYFEVTEKNSFNDEGMTAVIRMNETVAGVDTLKVADAVKMTNIENKK